MKHVWPFLKVRSLARCATISKLFKIKST